MRFEQVKDVLQHVIGFHQSIANDYAAMAEQTDNPRVKMLLGYLEDHLRGSIKGLDAYLHGDAQNVLNTWLQHVPEMEYPQLLETLRDQLSVASVEDVASTAEKIQETLADMFWLLSEQAAIDSERELFASLAYFQNAEVRRLARDTARFEG